MKVRNKMDGITVRDSIDLNTATEEQLLWYAEKYLERVRAHSRLVWAVRRAARRLESAKGGNGHAVSQG